MLSLLTQEWLCVIPGILVLFQEYWCYSRILVLFQEYQCYSRKINVIPGILVYYYSSYLTSCDTNDIVCLNSHNCHYSINRILCKASVVYHYNVHLKKRFSFLGFFFLDLFLLEVRRDYCQPSLIVNFTNLLVKVHIELIYVFRSVIFYLLVVIIM